MLREKIAFEIIENIEVQNKYKFNTIPEKDKSTKILKNDM